MPFANASSTLRTPPSLPAHDRTAPTDPSAEAMVLSAMLLDPEAAGNCFDLIGNNVAVFTVDQNACFYLVLQDLFNANKPLDINLIQSRIQQKKQSEFLPLQFIHDVISTAPTHHMAEHHALLLIECERKRRLISALHKSLDECYDSETDAKTLADGVESRIFAASDQQDVSGGVKTLADALDDLMVAGPEKRGLATGYYELDKLLHGLQPGELSILAARPSVGKTSLAMCIATHVALNLKLPVAFFSIEMRQRAILERLLSTHARVSMQRIRSNLMAPDEKLRVGDAFGSLREAEIFIDDCSSLTAMQLRAKARRLKKKHGIELIIVDYLQLMDSSQRAENRQQEITKISRSIKTLAGELDTHVMCLSQLNRASESESRRPRSSDLRESGAIEQDADVVLLLHREAVLHRSEPEWANMNPNLVNVAELIVAKQRNGPCETVKMTFLDHCTRFENHASY